VGGLSVGILATKQGSVAFALPIPNGGAIEGQGKQFGWQIAGALFVIGWDGLWTSLILLFIKYVLRVPLRMSDEDLELGDDAIHGEEAYAIFHDGQRTMIHPDEDRSRPADVEQGVAVELSSPTDNGDPNAKNTKVA
jgi:Amt family ammonium transporter